LLVQMAKTPLHMACQRITMVRLLLANGANTNAIDKVSCVLILAERQLKWCSILEPADPLASGVR
jgi:hypothetical protein